MPEDTTPRLTVAATMTYHFHWRGDDSRPMRVVITHDNDVSFEESTGRDALGVERWTPVDFYAETRDGYPEMGAHEWAVVAALAVARGELGADVMSTDTPRPGNIARAALAGGPLPDLDSPRPEGADRYPLWCVDQEDAAGERQYLGPYDTEVLATNNAGPDEPVRRCRRVEASELGLDVDEMVELFDGPATEGNVPDGAWADFEEEVVSLSGLGTVATDAFWAWADVHLTVKAFVCEGDE